MIYLGLIILALIVIYMCVQIFTLILRPENSNLPRMSEKNRKQLIIVTFVFGLVLALCCSQIGPPSQWDLFRHYEEIDRMRTLGAGYAFKNGIYKDFFLVNLFFYLISLTGSNGLLVFLSLTIETFIFCYYLNDQIHSDRIIRTGTFAICFLAFWPTLNIVYAVSGIRNVLATSIGMLALYIDLMKNKSKVISILLYVAAVFIHPFAAIYIVLRLLTNIRLKFISVVVTFSWFALYDLIYNLFRKIPIRIFQVISVNMYIHNIDYSSDVRLIVLYALFIFTVLIFTIVDKKDNSLKHAVTDLRWDQASLLYEAFTLGALFNFLYFQRATYGIAFVMLPIISNQMKGRNRVLVAILVSIFAIIANYFQIIRMYNVVVYGT